MGLTKVSTDGVKDDAITSGKIPANAVGTSELADNAVTAGKTSGVQTTINNNADNRLITGSGTANTLNAESGVLYDGTNFGIGKTPSRTLDVAGKIRSSDSVCFGDNSSTPSEGAAIHRPATSTLGFVTADTERMRIDSSGNLGIKGSATSDSNRMQIRVNDTQNEFRGSSNSGTSRGFAFYASNTNVSEIATLDSDGLKFGTDTAAANALDDYEEGTWTPTNTIGLTLTNNNPAYYIKIGKLVMIQFDVSFSGASDTAQCGVIQSLPFTSENTTNHFSQGPLPHISTNSNFDLDPNLDDLLLFIGPDESRIDIFSFSINAQAARSSLVGRRIRHQMIYKAA